uniref:T cell receptor beta variable 15 n=1 Tax=Spermophilus dauricus TaxID=99837 RepID=A0A8C9ULQ8_SPEDA
MGPGLLHCITLCLLVASPVTAMVMQNPRYRTTRVGKPVNLSCSQTLNHDTMYWYQQKPSHPPKLLLYYYDDQLNKQTDTSDNFQASRPKTSLCSLDIRSAGLEDSASVPECSLLATTTPGPLLLLVAYTSASVIK